MISAFFFPLLVGISLNNCEGRFVSLDWAIVNLSNWINDGIKFIEHASIEWSNWDIHFIIFSGAHFRASATLHTICKRIFAIIYRTTAQQNVDVRQPKAQFIFAFFVGSVGKFYRFTDDKNWLKRPALMIMKRAWPIYFIWFFCASIK